MLEKSKIKGFIEDLEIEIDNIEGKDSKSLKIRNLLSNAVEAGKTYDAYFTSTNARKFERAVEACEEELERKIHRYEPYDFDEEDVDDLITEYQATLESVKNVYEEETSKGRLTGYALKEGKGFFDACTKDIKLVIAALEKYKAEPNSKNAKKVTKAVEEYRKVADNILAFYNNDKKKDKPTAKGIWGKVKNSALDMDPKKALKNMGGCLRWAFYLFAAALVVDQFLTVGPALAAFVSVGTTLGIAGCAIGLVYNGGKFIINKTLKGKDFVVGRDPIAIKRKLASALDKNKGKGKDAKVVERKVPRAEAAESEKETRTKKEKHDSFFELLEDCLKGILIEESGKIKINSDRVKMVKDLLSNPSEYFVSSDEINGDETVAKLRAIIDLYDLLKVIPTDAKDIVTVMDQSVIQRCLTAFDNFLAVDLTVNGKKLTEDDKTNLIGRERYGTMKVAYVYKFVAIMDKINRENKCTESYFYEAQNLYKILPDDQKTRYASRCKFYEKIVQLYELGKFLEMSEEDMREMTVAELKAKDTWGTEIIGYFMSNEGGEEFIRSVIPRSVSKFDKFNRVLMSRGIYVFEAEVPHAPNPYEGIPHEEPPHADKPKPVCEVIESEYTQVVGENFILRIDLPLGVYDIGDLDESVISFNSVQLRNVDRQLYIAGTPLKAGKTTIPLLDVSGNKVVEVIINSREKVVVRTENPFEGMHEPRDPLPEEAKPAEEDKPKTRRKKSVRDTLPRVQADYSTFKSEQLAEVYRSALKEMEIAHDDMDSIEFRRGLSKALKIFDYASKNSLMAMFSADDVKKVKEYYDEYKTHVAGKTK